MVSGCFDYQSEAERRKNGPTYYFEQGESDNIRSSYYEAISKFQKAIELDPNYTEAIYRLAYAYLKAGKSNEALPYCMEAIHRGFKKDYLQRDAYQLAGEIYEDLGFYNDALEYYTKNKELIEKDGYSRNLGWAEGRIYRLKKKMEKKGAKKRCQAPKRGQVNEKTHHHIIITLHPSVCPDLRYR